MGLLVVRETTYGGIEASDFLYGGGGNKRYGGAICYDGIKTQ